MSAYRIAAEPAEPPFEAEAHALAALDEEEGPEGDGQGVPSVLMRAEDFVDPRTGRSDERDMAIVILTILAMAAVAPVTVALVWLGERFL